MDIFVYSARYFSHSFCERLRLLTCPRTYEASSTLGSKNHTFVSFPGVWRLADGGRGIKLFVGVTAVPQFG